MNSSSNDKYLLMCISQQNNPAVNHQQHIAKRNELIEFLNTNINKQCINSDNIYKYNSEIIGLQGNYELQGYYKNEDSIMCIPESDREYKDLINVLTDNHCKHIKSISSKTIDKLCKNYIIQSLIGEDSSFNDIFSLYNEIQIEKIRKRDRSREGDRSEMLQNADRTLIGRNGESIGGAFLKQVDQEKYETNSDSNNFYAGKKRIYSRSKKDKTTNGTRKLSKSKLLKARDKKIKKLTSKIKSVKKT